MTPADRRNAYATRAIHYAKLRAIALRNRDPIGAAVHEDSIVALADACIYTLARVGGAL